MSEKKYQRITVAIAVVNTAYAFSANTDTLYSRIKRCWAYTGTSFASNRNVIFTKPLKINGDDIYPDNFDSALLFPRVENEVFISHIKDTKAAGSYVEGEVADFIALGFVAETFTLVLELEKE